MKSKANIDVFNKEVSTSGVGYLSRSDALLSARVASNRTYEVLSSEYDFNGKTVLDVGCGDGKATSDFFSKCRPKYVLGIDAAHNAIEYALRTHSSDGKIEFMAVNAYDLCEKIDHRFDVGMMLFVLHHLPDPSAAVKEVVKMADTIIIAEPNGNSPIRKILERVSKYRIECEEQSFSASTIKGWFFDAGFRIEKSKYVNCVPLFCPDWMVGPLKLLEFFVERVPLLRNLLCGQYILVAIKDSVDGE